MYKIYNSLTCSIKICIWCIKAGKEKNYAGSTSSAALFQLFQYYSVFQKSDAKIEIIITATNLIRIIYPLSSLNYHLSGANVANFNKIHCTVFEQQVFKKWSSKTEVSNMEKSPYQFVRNTTSYSLCSKWSPFAQTFACLLCRPYVLCCYRTSCLQTL